MRTAFTIVVVTSLFLAPVSVHAIFNVTEALRVPISRVTDNLEKRVADDLKPPADSASIQIGQILRLTVLEEKNLSGRYVVTTNGTIRLARNFGEIKVAGKDLNEAERAVETALTNKLSRAHVILEVEPEVRRDLADPAQKLQHFYALARIHAMAYATQPELWDLPTPAHEPYVWPHEVRFNNTTVTLNANAARKEQAAAHLQRAIEYYRKALELDPKNLAVLLGVGWSLDQSGDKSAARDTYRLALKEAWATESALPTHPPGPTFTDEIGAYLLKLLDPVTDADEIATIKRYTSELVLKPRLVTPILIPLEDAKFEDLVNPNAHVAFDLDGSGYQREWGWITPKAGWLVYDHDGKGEITSGLQLFGSVTFWIFWPDGYQALSSLDDDGNGWLEGAELEHLAIWRDANSNGISEPGEVRPLSELGITGIACRNQTPNGPLPSHPQGVRLKDGSFRPSYDWLAPGHPATSPVK